MRAVGRWGMALGLVGLLSGMRVMPASLEAVVAASGLERPSVAMLALNSGQWSGIEPDRPVVVAGPAALPLAEAVYLEAAAGRLALEMPIGAPAAYGPPGAPDELDGPLPLREALDWAAGGHGGARRAIAEALGPERLAADLATLGAPQSRFLPDGRLETTARDLAALAAKAARAEVAGPGESEAVLMLLGGPALGERAVRFARTPRRLGGAPDEPVWVGLVEQHGMLVAVAALADAPATGPVTERLEALASEAHASALAAEARDWERLPVLRVVSPYHDSREGTAIDAIVLHHTVIGQTAEDVADYFRRGDVEASAHYIVGRDGRIVQAVDDCLNAWHAGVSEFQGRPKVNRFSIGIELVNKGDGRDPYPDAQYKALARLMRQLMREYDIPWSRVTGHRDVALPRGRKVDPSDNFSFKRLKAELDRLN